MTKRVVRTKPHENLVPFPFQLLDVRLYEVVVERFDSLEEESGRTPISIGLASLPAENEDEQFRVHLALDASFPVDDEPLCKIHLTVEGIFQPIVDIRTVKPEVIERFKNNDSIVLFWPYLRETLHDLTTRMRLGIPPLPVIDPRMLVKETPESEERIPETT